MSAIQYTLQASRRHVTRALDSLGRPKERVVEVLVVEAPRALAEAELDALEAAYRGSPAYPRIALDGAARRICGGRAYWREEAAQEAPGEAESDDRAEGAI